MAIKGIVFDFDGLILDTETPEFDTLQKLFGEYGLRLPLSEWQKALGASIVAFDPIEYLQQQLGREIDQKSIHQRWRRESMAIIESNKILPGVVSILDQASQIGLKIGLASSSPYDWVNTHLTRIGLKDRFECIRCAEDVEHTKPSPDLYISALKGLGIAPAEAIAFEDSPNGITSARAAGLFCIAIPNQLTRLLDTSHANLELQSLEGIDVTELINIASNGHK